MPRLITDVTQNKRKRVALSKMKQNITKVFSRRSPYSPIGAGGFTVPEKIRKNNTICSKMILESIIRTTIYTSEFSVHFSVIGL